MEKLKTFFLRQIRYPELIVMLVVSTYLAITVSPILYQIAFLFVVCVSGVLLAITVQKNRHIRFDGYVLFILAFNLGLFQLNYLPSACLWLIFAYRLFLINKKNFIAPFAIGGISITIATIFLLKTLNIPLSLAPRQQLIINALTILFSGLMFAHQMWYLIKKIQFLAKSAKYYRTRFHTMLQRTNKLTRFLPPQIWQPILHQNKPISVVNQRRKLTILFSDIVGFTDLSDNISPDHLANILNTYFDAMTRITQKYGATLDKFIGDGLLCFFGDTPDSNEKQDALRCVIMAIEMRREMQVLRRHWHTQGFEGLHVRIGINTGYCYVGNFGSRNRMTYTVIGKEANFASRLESSAKPNQILISQSTYNLISHKLNCKSVGQIKLKGLQELVPIWEVLDPRKGDKNNDDWLDFQLSGFNLHLNFEDIQSNDKQTIIRHLHQAIELVDKKTE